MLSVDQVLQIIAENVMPVAAQPLALAAARGGVLAAPIAIDQDSPSFDRAQLDGFAVQSAGAREGAELQLVGQIDAGGNSFQGTIDPGQCTGINTGGVMPAGADGVLMVEHATKISKAGGDFIRVNKSVPPGYGIQRRGSDAAAGEVVLREGVKLQGPQLAVCAAAGAGRPLVRKIRIAVLTTGDELVDVTQEAALVPTGKIRNSNHPMLVALACDAAGSDAVLNLGTAPDDPVAVRAALAKGLQEADLLIVAGGMSMGTRDLVPPLLKELGVHFHVEKVKIKPGKPFVLGLWDGPKGTREGRSYVAGLPGNPVSAYVTFQCFVREMIRRLSGETVGPGPIVQAKIAAPLPANSDREFYQPCRLRHEGSTLVAEVIAWKGSANLFSLAGSDGLVIRPASAPELQAGSAVDVLITS